MQNNESGLRVRGAGQHTSLTFTVVGNTNQQKAVKVRNKKTKKKCLNKVSVFVFAVELDVGPSGPRADSVVEKTKFWEMLRILAHIQLSFFIILRCRCQ